MVEAYVEQFPEQFGDNLTPEQIAALEAGPGLVSQPVVDELVTPEVYRSSEYRTKKINVDGGLGNFSNYFMAPGGWSADIERAALCRQRFAIIYPELTAQLEELVAEGITTHPDFDGWKLDPLYLEAYDYMKQLVDKSDPHVAEGGRVDSLYLVR